VTTFPAFTVKAKTCTAPGCCREFIPARPMQSVCSHRCAKRKVDAAKRAERQAVKARKEKLKRIPDLIREAQTAFNAFIRARDEGRPCICCGRLRESAFAALKGGEWDCGHYRSTGSASHLRFHEDNAHRQLKVCNRHGAGRAVDYRIGLIARIGLARVEALEASNEPHKWTREELIAIRDTYRAKLKALKANE
jgi:hypothetical protein